jgi:hypothetical protein
MIFFLPPSKIKKADLTFAKPTKRGDIRPA